MNIRTTLASLAAVTSIAALSACGASGSPALEKGQPVDGRSVTKTQSAPEECQDAFDSASDVSMILADALDISAEAVGYAMDLDHISLEQANNDLDALVQPLEDARTDYQVSAAVCESGNPPPACLDALSSAEDVDRLLSDGLQSASRSLQYAVDLDVAGLDEETAYVEGLTAEVEIATDDFHSQSTECTATEGV